MTKLVLKGLTYIKLVNRELVKNTPVFTSASTATDGQDGCFMLSDQGYYNITGDSLIRYPINRVPIFYMQNAVKINFVGYTPHVWPEVDPALVLNNLEASSDGIIWDRLSDRWGGRGLTEVFQFPAENTYKYFRFTSSNDDGRHSNGCVTRFYINYSVHEQISVPGTADDHDIAYIKDTFFTLRKENSDFNLKGNF